MKIETMEDLFQAQLRDLYDAEQRLTKALPRMAEAASSERLKEALTEHLEQTRGHVRRLEEIFGDLRQRPSAQTCEAMKGLIEEGEEIAREIAASPVRDAGIIAAGNRVEHYEIAAYGTARTYAQILGHQKASRALDETLEEEKQADERLTRIAESMINEQALHLGARQER